MQAFMILVVVLGTTYAQNYAPPSPGVVINEVITNSIAGASTFNGIDSVEFFNPTSLPIDLSGMYIIDSSSNLPYPYYTFAQNTTIAPREFLVLQQNFNFTFGLGANDNVRLFRIKPGSLAPNQTQDTLIDGYSWSAHQLPGGRCPDGSNNWIYPQVAPSLGSNNKCSYNIVVNEVITNPPNWPSYTGTTHDSVELYNPTSKPFDISDMYMVDSTSCAVTCADGSSCTAGANCAASCLSPSFDCGPTTNAYTFPAGTIIPGNGFLSVSNPSNFSFGLKSSENIRIFAKIGTSPDQSRDMLAFGLDFSAHDAVHQMSGGRCPDGGDLWVGGTASAQMWPTIGAANNCTAPTAAANLSGPCWSQPVCASSAPRPRHTSEGAPSGTPPPAGDAPSAFRGRVVINEVDHSGAPSDWVELRNVWTGHVDLSGWVFRDNDDAHTFVLPPAAPLAPGERRVLDGFGFGLGAPSDAARLWDPAGGLVDNFTWHASAGAADYARCPDGTGGWAVSFCKTKGRPNGCGPADAALCDGAAAAGNASASGPAAPPFPMQSPAFTTAVPSAANAAGAVVAFEPSGGAWHPAQRNVWLAGDAGFVGRMDPDGGNLRVWAKAGDLEGIAVARPASPYVYLLDEDDGTIHEFDPAGPGATTRVFNLLAAAAAPGVAALTDADRDALVDAGPFNAGGDGTGGEALAFLPDPADAEGGVFWVGSQENGRVYRFRLPLASGGTAAVFLGRFGDWPAADTDLASLEYDWASGAVLAIFDEPNLLRLLAANGTLLQEWSALPGLEQEGLAANGTSLWIAQDGPGTVARFDGFAPRPATGGRPAAEGGSCAGPDLSCCARRWNDPSTALFVDAGPGARVVSLEVYVEGQPGAGVGRFTEAQIAGLLVAAGDDRRSLVPCGAVRVDVPEHGCGLLVRTAQCYTIGARAVQLRLPSLGGAPAGGAVMVQVCAQVGLGPPSGPPRFPVSFNRCQ